MTSGKIEASVSVTIWRGTNAGVLNQFSPCPFVCPPIRLKWLEVMLSLAASANAGKDATMILLVLIIAALTSGGERIDKK